MAQPPRRPRSATEKAEEAFRALTTKTDEPKQTNAAIPAGKELISIRIDRDVLEHFQADGAGWQERINAALRAAADLE
ncbi:BrnA antitoxin family protein [Devosia riboflavina]